MLENNHTIHLTLNGESRAFTVEPRETLLHVLRERAHLTGAKKGCDLGECGACTVIMDGRAVNSCCVFAIEADGSTVETIEGIGTADEPHPLQQAFIDAGKSLDLRIHAAINTFTGGNQTLLGGAGVVFRDEAKRAWTTDLNLAGGITNIMSTSQSAKFFNPVLPEVQEYLCSMLRDLAAYDGLAGIFLDRGRFDGFTSDFSNYTRKEFEKYIGQSVAGFPADILPAGHTSGIPSPVPVHMKQWLEFRAKVIHDFMEKARAAVKSVNPSVKFGVYVGGWYASYYDVGVNWASPNYDTSSKFSWATKKYMNYGYADLMDQMLIGAYASPTRVYGTTEWTMQGFCLLAKERTMGACPMVAGGPDVGNWDADDKVPQEEENRAITASVAACINACDGYFLFDMIHLKKADQWSYVKTGIDGVIKKD